MHAPNALAQTTMSMAIKYIITFGVGIGAMWTIGKLFPSVSLHLQRWHSGTCIVVHSIDGYNFAASIEMQGTGTTVDNNLRCAPITGTHWYSVLGTPCYACFWTLHKRIHSVCVNSEIVILSTGECRCHTHNNSFIIVDTIRIAHTTIRSIRPQQMQQCGVSFAFVFARNCLTF